MSVRLFTNLLEGLTTPHGVDRYLELLHPMLTVRELRAEITEVHRSTSDSVTLTLRPNRHWRGFTAGQYVRVTVDIDGVRRSRCYSPSCSQHRADGRIQLTVKAHEHGLVSRFLHANARQGLVVGLSQAEGVFTLPQRRPQRIVLISGGSGITPVLSMLRTLCDERYSGEVTFLHFAPTEADVPQLDRIRALAGRHPRVRFVLACTRRGEYFSQERLAAAAPEYSRAHTYLCGPPGLLHAVRELYLSEGVGERLHTEDFGPVALPRGDLPASGHVHFRRSDVAAANSGATLLEQAEGAGLHPEHGCRMGICFSCTTIKRAGQVRNIRTGDTSSEEDEEIQLCISVPVGDVTIDI
ncbi:MAG: ferredoxin reductase [Labedaea sp.]